MIFKKGEVTIFNRAKAKEKQMKKWEETRKLGMWGYIFLYGILLGATVFLITRYVFYMFQNYLFVFSEHIIPSLLFGLTFGLLSWILNERRYKKMKMDNLHG